MAANPNENLHPKHKIRSALLPYLFAVSSALAACSGKAQLVDTTPQAPVPTATPESSNILHAVHGQDGTTVVGYVDGYGIYNPILTSEVNSAITPNAGGAEVQATSTPDQTAIATVTPAKNELMNVSINNLREAILTIDETAVPWPDVRDQKKGYPEQDTQGLPEHRARVDVDTGTDDMTYLGGGRFDFHGTIGNVGQTDSGKKLDGYDGQVIIDPVSKEVIAVVNGDKISLPGGSDNFFRTNIILIVGNHRDNTVTKFEVDTASCFKEQRATGIANTSDPSSDLISAEGMQWLAAYAKPYVRSAGEAGHCHGAEGCGDAVGVYLVKGAHDDPPVGQPAKLLFGAVFTGAELRQAFGK